MSTKITLLHFLKNKIITIQNESNLKAISVGFTKKTKRAMLIK